MCCAWIPFHQSCFKVRVLPKIRFNLSQWKAMLHAWSDWYFDMRGWQSVARECAGVLCDLYQITSISVLTLRLTATTICSMYNRNWGKGSKINFFSNPSLNSYINLHSNPISNVRLRTRSSWMLFKLWSIINSKNMIFFRQICSE